MAGCWDVLEGFFCWKSFSWSFCCCCCCYTVTPPEKRTKNPGRKNVGNRGVFWFHRWSGKPSKGGGGNSTGDQQDEKVWESNMKKFQKHNLTKPLPICIKWRFSPKNWRLELWHHLLFKTWVLNGQDLMTTSHEPPRWKPFVVAESFCEKPRWWWRLTKAHGVLVGGTGLLLSHNKPTETTKKLGWVWWFSWPDFYELILKCFVS